MLAIGLVNCVQQLAEARSFLNGPKPGECGAEPFHILTGQQTYSDNPGIGHANSSCLIYVRTRPSRRSALCFVALPKG
jgi:hypothetical protein